VGQIKGLLSKNVIKRREPDNSSKPNRTRKKGSLPEKNTNNKKELLALTLGNVADGRS
jgi:hypothetical protein